MYTPEPTPIVMTVAAMASIFLFTRSDRRTDCTLVVALRPGCFTTFRFKTFLTTFLRTFLTPFLVVFFAVFLVAFLVVFFAVFLVTFLVVFLTDLLATFLRTVFLRTFFTAGAGVVFSCSGCRASADIVAAIIADPLRSRRMQYTMNGLWNN